VKIGLVITECSPERNRIRSASGLTPLKECNFLQSHIVKEYSNYLGSLDRSELKSPASGWDVRIFASRCLVRHFLAMIKLRGEIPVESQAQRKQKGVNKGIESGTDRQPVTIPPGLSPRRVSIVHALFFLITRRYTVGLWSDE
jgi:hypothetical protein